MTKTRNRVLIVFLSVAVSAAQYWVDELENIAAELSSSDYVNNRDPVMDAIGHHDSANK